LRCDYNLEIKLKKKYLSKNGFLNQNTDDRVKCRKCNEEMEFVKERFLICNSFDDDNSIFNVNVKNDDKEPRPKANESQFAHKKKEAVKSHKFLETNENKVIQELEKKGLTENDVIISPIKKREEISILNLSNESWACIINQTKNNLNLLKIPSILKNCVSDIKTFDKSYYEKSNIFNTNNNYIDNKTSTNSSAFLNKYSNKDANKDKTTKGFNNKGKRSYNDF